MRKFQSINNLPTDGRLYKNERYNIIESVIPPKFNSSHACDLLELPNGDLLCAWFAGSEEGNSDIRIVVSRLNKDSDKWTEPQYLSDNNGCSDQNPSLFLHPNGEIWAMFTVQNPKENIDFSKNFNLQFTSKIYRKVSTDNGYTWSQSQVMFETKGTFCRQKIQVLSNGDFIFGTWMCFDDDTKMASDITEVYRSSNQGLSWEKVTIPNSRGKVHLNMIELSDGKVIGFLRSRAADYIYYTESLDYGKSWSSPIRTSLPNNNSSISAIKLKSGKIAIAFNDLGFNELQDIAVWPYERPSITLAISEDEGRSFPLKRIVEFGSGFTGLNNRQNNKRYEYPCIVQSENGELIVGYSYNDRESIKVVFVDEDWINS